MSAPMAASTATAAPKAAATAWQHVRFVVGAESDVFERKADAKRERFFGMGGDVEEDR
jgi:hypothetical protein